MPDPERFAALREEALTAEISSLQEFSDKLYNLTGPGSEEIQAIVKYRTGDIAGALPLFSAAAAKQACHPRSLLMFMRGQYAMGDMDGAVATARRLVELEPGNREALRTAGRIHNQRRTWDQADRFWRRLCELCPEDPEAALQVARIAVRRAQWDTVEFFSDLHLRSFPDHAEALRIGVDSRLRQRKTEGLEALIPALYRAEPDRARNFLKSLARPEEAVKLAGILRRLCDIDPEDQEVHRLLEAHTEQWLTLALQHEVARRDDLAAQLFRAVLKAAPGSREAADGMQRVRRSAVLAMRAAQKSGDDTEVTRQAERVLEMDPEVFDAWFALGRIRLAAGRAREAAALFRRCVELQPGDPWFQLNLGRAAERSDDLEGALQAYQEVVNLLDEEDNARRREALQSMGNIRQRLHREARDAYRDGDLERAWGLYSLAAQLPDASPGIASTLEAIRRALFLELREKFNAQDPCLVAAAEAYLAKDPDNQQALLYLARRLMPAREHARALAVWTRLRQAEPENAHYLLQIARCCSWLKRAEEGAAAACEALRLDPGLAEAASLLRQFEAS